MKTHSLSRLLAPLFLITVPANPEIARADVTLVYGEVVATEKIPEKEKVISAQRIYVRDGDLALETYGKSRVVIYNRESGTVRMVDHEREIFMDLDDAMVAQISERLTETQRKVLEGFEAKASDLPKRDRERLRGVLDDLHAATAQQLTKVPDTTYRDSEESSKVGEFETSVVEAFQDDRRWARYHLVDHEKLGMSEDEYETLVEFQKLVRRLSEQTPGALRKNFGDLEMLAKSGRIPVKVERFLPDPGTQRLLNHFDREIKPDWFTIPESYQPVTLRPNPIPPEEGA